MNDFRGGAPADRRAPVKGRTAAARTAWVLAVLSLAMMAAGSIGDAFTGADEGTWFEDLALFVSFCTFPVVGALVIGRSERNPLGWVMLGIGVFGGLTFVSMTYAYVAFTDDSVGLPFATLAAWLAGWTWFTTIQLVFPMLIFYFPNGQLLSKRWRPVIWIAWAVVAITSIAPMFQARLKDLPTYNIDNPIGIAAIDDAEAMMGPLFFVLAVLCVLAVVSLIVRFVRSSGTERLQLKWFTFAAVVLVGSIFLEEVFGTSGIFFSLGMIGLPIAMGMAILRYRLYEIDLIINRALVYGLLTGSAIFLYLGIVVALQLVVDSFTEESDLAVAASTLAVAALVRPLRGRIQSFIDRRFYRRKYNSAQALSGFAGRLRDEVDLNVVEGDVLSVLKDTVQPSHASVWLAADRSAV